MKLIPLTKDLFAKVDDEDYEHLSAYYWHLANGYARRKVSVDEGSKRKSTNMEHQIVPGFVPYIKVVDHINGDKLDNQRANLRLVDKSLNGINKRGKPGASGYYGISHSRGTDSWRSCIRYKGKIIWQMYGNDIKAMAKARENALQELFET